MWTYRALERAGYRVTPEGEAPLGVDIIEANGKPTWRIVGCDGAVSSIEELLAAIDRQNTATEKEKTHE
jgi:hypothetical protein